jgi:hypothetical protein
MTRSHISYVGPAEIHDGHLVAVERAGDKARVRIRGADGEPIALEFLGVTEFSAVRPEGMLLYGLAELRSEGEAHARRFIFANWEEWDDAGLEIAARDFRVLPEGEVDLGGPVS